MSAGGLHYYVRLERRGAGTADIEQSSMVQQSSRLRGGGSVITQIVTWRPKQTFYLFDLYLLDLVCQTFFLSLSA